MARKAKPPVPASARRDPTGRDWRHRQQAHQQQAQQHQLVMTNARSRNRAPRQKKV